MNNMNIKNAVEALKSGNLVVFPTETVYGLGADASNEQAVEKIFSLKQRPKNHPLIVHLSDLTKINLWAKEINDNAYEWIEKFSPGPVTFILKKNKNVLDVVTGGQSTIAIRIPDHPVAKMLLASFDGGIAAPSANPYGYVSPTRAEHISEVWRQKGIITLDGGASPIGIESTIIDLTTDKAKIRRLGMISTKLKLYMEEKGVDSASVFTDQKVPGNVIKHYSPHNSLYLLSIEEIRNFIATQNQEITVLSFHSQPCKNENIHWVKMSFSVDSYAHDLYHYLRQADKINNSIILVEKVPSIFEWKAIEDRLSKASVLFDKIPEKCYDSII
jgi:L-threonylcarbamoyladenylate synthase